MVNWLLKNLSTFRRLGACYFQRETFNLATLNDFKVRSLHSYLRTILFPLLTECIFQVYLHKLLQI